MMLLCAALLTAGCTAEKDLLRPDGNRFTLTVRCEDALPTRSEGKDGEQAFNENLIQSVDFLFYVGAAPDADADAVYHVRKELAEDPMTEGDWSVTFDLVAKKDLIQRIFPGGDQSQATVYALVNFDASFIGSLSQTSRNELEARRMVTDFAQTEVNYVQPNFLMDGRQVVTYYDRDDNQPNVQEDIQVKRLAAKLTMAIHVEDEVILKHDDSLGEEPEVWTPVPHTMRLYLVDGVKSCLLTPDARDGDNPEAFSYQDDSHRRPFMRDNGKTYFPTETVDQKLYYHTWPMYSYPAQWTLGPWDYPNTDFSQGRPTEPPYFKLEMDWRREARNGYTYDRRKYYYKVFIPLEQLDRNNWYDFYLDVAILGSETDEGKALLTPSCYLLDWQNKSLAINKSATISKARYLSLEKSNWEINNQATLSIPFISSHNVKIVTTSIRATRPYYGEITSTVGERVGDYNPKMHGYICQDGDSYYLDFVGQPADAKDRDKYEPEKWIDNTSTSIVLDHPLQNEYEKDGFDYSPYTIEFDIIHDDLVNDPTSHTYQQYLRHIRIVQYPGIYIEAIRNSDWEVELIGTKLCGYPTGEKPWLNKPWGYVYVNGGRFIRRDNVTTSASIDPYYHLATNEDKAEYQWQTVWYTGGSRFMFNIHVTVLPESSGFVIGDPRVDDVDNLDDPAKYPGLYSFTVNGGAQDLAYLEAIREGSIEYPDGTRTGFNSATAIYGDSPRTLTWYYPCDDDDNRTANMVAPGYRIASKFGGTEYGNLDKKHAIYRCAAYQEDGFPAGRWRLPTKAEIHFIAQLSAKKAFERLFETNSRYWSANGAVTVNGSDVTDSSEKTALLRCVYDSWYWDQVDLQNHLVTEEEPRHSPRSLFKWGDKPKWED